MLTKEYVLECIDKHCTLDEQLSEGTFFHQVVDPLESACCFDTEWTWDSGASKGVLIFEELSFVIKIPFYAEWLEEYWEYDEEADEDVLIEGGETSDCCFAGVEVEGYCHRNEWDYCETETYRYEVAEKNDMGEHFAKTWFLKEIHGWPIYAQVRACMFRSEASYSARSRKNYSQEQRDTVRKLRDEECCYIEEEWVMDFIEFFGLDRFYAFLAFCDEWDIDDLHGGNLGYIDGVPCLVDYSSFNV